MLSHLWNNFLSFISMEKMNKIFLDCWIFFTHDKCNCLYCTEFVILGILLTEQRMLICIKKKFWCFNFPRSLASLSELLIRLTIWFKWVSRLIFSFSTEAKLRPLESNFVSRHSRSCFFPSFALSLYLKKISIILHVLKYYFNTYEFTKTNILFLTKFHDI